MPRPMSRWVFPVPGIAEHDDGVTGVEVFADGEDGDGRRGDQNEVCEAVGPREFGFGDAASAAAFGDLECESVGEEPEIGGSGPFSLVSEPSVLLADPGAAELSGRGLDRRE